MSLSAKFYDLVRRQLPRDDADAIEDLLRDGSLQDEQREQIEHDRQILEGEDETGGEISREAQKQLRLAAETSLRQLQVIQRGRCPQCGAHLRQHLFARICDNCGWNSYDTPRQGRVRVHLSGASPQHIDGERCYFLKDGTVLLLRDDAVVARLQQSAIAWIEYLWDQEELESRQREALDHLTILCGWCNQVVDPEADGFHLVQVAFGATQERYCFCSDDCYEAFRKMYPSRVHRNCYERSCSDCNLCIKRYEDEAEGIRTLAKDYLLPRKRGER